MAVTLVAVTNGLAFDVQKEITRYAVVGNVRTRKVRIYPSISMEEPSNRAVVRLDRRGNCEALPHVEICVVTYKRADRHRLRGNMRMVSLINFVVIGIVLEGLSLGMPNEGDGLPRLHTLLVLEATQDAN